VADARKISFSVVANGLHVTASVVHCTLVDI